ncbi:hypothetical protein VIGAN_01133600 [Vigna angularis var. angularis]|uniref:F-box domain-containing protein n=1 Tax=Vigna angularis var. angularis TaxID=157739 RepID=A0A0S3QZL7_PHAAN|nr:hypothetical protein VIGAN_01133600 [Vigna angularis var. angularis]
MALGFEGYSYTTALGRKRVVLLHNVEVLSPLKRTRSEKITFDSETSPLEALPLEILVVKVLCGVDHEDLEQLVRVSKTVREATEIARKTNFEYRTPKKKTFAISVPYGVEGEEIEAPNAPLRKPKSKLIGKNLSSITMALFASPTKEDQ